MEKPCPENRKRRRKGMGRTAPPEVVLIFRGTHQVMSAEKNLKREGVPTKLIPVPGQLSSDCGFAIRILPPDKGRAKEVLRNNFV